jgi:hypothetical protein
MYETGLAATTYESLRSTASDLDRASPRQTSGLERRSRLRALLVGFFSRDVAEPAMA